MNNVCLISRVKGAIGRVGTLERYGSRALLSSCSWLFPCIKFRCTWLSDDTALLLRARWASGFSPPTSWTSSRRASAFTLFTLFRKAGPSLGILNLSVARAVLCFPWAVIQSLETDSRSSVAFSQALTAHKQKIKSKSFWTRPGRARARHPTSYRYTTVWKLRFPSLQLLT